MLNIVLLANQERLIRLFNDSGIVNAGTVRVSKDVEEALSAISAKAQNLVFIQERMGEMSGELLAYRMGAQLKGKKARIVLFGDPDAIPATARKPIHAVLDTGLSDRELTAAVMAILATPTTRAGKRKTPRKNKPAPQAQGIRSAETMPHVVAEAVDDVVEIRGETPSVEDEHSPRQRYVAGETPKASFQDNLDHAMGETDGAPLVPRRGIPLVAPEPSAGPIRVTWGKPTLLSRIRDRLFRPKILVILASVFVCFTVLALFLLFHERRQTADHGTAASTSGGKGKAVSRPFLDMPGGLPSFLPRKSADPDYAKANPGWERYRDTSTEYRVYREKGAIRAFQFIDRSGQGISPGLLTGVLMETAGSPQYVIETTEQKGSFTIEKGRVVNGDVIIIYRKEPERSVKAFVLELK
ncbi:MAG TPA: hypothetical protein PLI53_10860 [Geobacteraceae bacterium]|nr:hypothetical protein [Geobacteraceae bacterium]